MPRDEASGPANADRDGAELELCGQALAAGPPLLGICRGLQVINVALGGRCTSTCPTSSATTVIRPRSADTAQPT